ncbi:MAG: DUF3658 domain-containing protein [Rhizomicrobium sp.]
MSVEAKFASATHIVFTQSGAGTLRQRISELGFSPKVICLWDNLSLGPLDCTVEARTEWFVEFFDNPGWSEVIQQRRAFWEDTAGVEGDCCVWFSRRQTGDYCGYLEWASRSQGRAHKIVDADMPVGLINILPDWLKYFAQARPADHDQQLLEAQDWRHLISENALVRKIVNGKIVSAPLDCFDGLLLAKATPEWKSAALMVGEVLGNDFEEIHQTGDLLLVNRLW